MVTVTGPGGVGKTRPALHVAREVAATRRDGGWFVDLVQVTEPQMVIAAVASAIGVVDPHGGSLDDAVVAALAVGDAVMVLDNCEHVIDAVLRAPNALGVVSVVDVVATSRARLVAPFERVYVVPGLSVTDDGGDAVTLFVERATPRRGRRRSTATRWPMLRRALDGMRVGDRARRRATPSWDSTG